MNTKRIAKLLVIVAVIAIIATTAYAARADDDGRRKIVGTWVCHVPGESPFHALQTFHEDGTFTETSSLLAQGQEGPAHGAWSRQGNKYQLTFQLFAFDPATAESTGMIRVRVSLVVNDRDHLTATFNVVEFIDPDGTITELFRGPDAYTCTRLKVVPVP